MDEIEELVEDVANQLKLHEKEIVNIGAHDEEESRRRRSIRYANAKQILSHPDLYIKVTTVEPFSYQGVVKDTKFTKYINIADKLKEKP